MRQLYSLRSAVYESELRGSSSSKQMADHEKMDTELQLLRVSNGAHKLTEMIDSLSTASNLNRQAKDIARELLKGAMDLHESLAMLRKLQDASKQLVKIRKKNMAAVDGEREARRSVDGSSKDCIEELRRVIRESFQRHNLLTRSFEDERALSSRSMRFNPETDLKDEHCEQSSDAFASSKKVKSPNLIAKLMGLEEVPSDEMKLSLKPLRTPMFDIHMPTVRKQQIMERSPDLQKKSQQDIIEKMQFKGILKSRQAEDLRIDPLAPNSSPSERYGSSCLDYDDEAPPIVIMKPLKPSERYGSCCLDYDDEAPPIVIMKPLKPSSQERGEAHKEFHLQINNVQEEAETVATGRTKIMEKPKAADSRKGKAIEKFKTRRKIVDGQKPLLTARKTEKEVKVRRPALSQDKTFKQSDMPEKKLAVEKNNVSAQVSALRKHKSNNPMQESTRNSASRKKKTSEAKLVKTSAIDTAVEDGRRSKEDHKVVKPLCETAAISTSASSTMPANGETKQTEVNQKHRNREDYKRLGEVLPKIISGERRSALAEETIQLYENRTTVGEDLKHILLSSQPFLKYAQKFISPNGHQPIYRRKNIEASGTRDAKLFLDCAIELMARKIQQKELASRSIFGSHIQVPKFYHSVDPLLLEISKGFEKLTTTYSAVNADATYEDTLYVKLETISNAKIC